MKVIADKEVLDYLKDHFAEKPDKAVRFQLVEVCCGNADLEMTYSEIKEDDICTEIEGIKFVADREYGFLINNVELEKTEYGVDIKRRYSC